MISGSSALISSLGSAYRFDGTMLHTLQLPKHDVGERYVAEHTMYRTPYAVCTVYRDKKQNVCIGTAAIGVCRNDGKTFLWIDGDDVNELNDAPSNGVRSIVEDRDSLYWFNTLFRYRVNEDGLFSSVKGIGTLEGKTDGNIHEYLSIAKDQQGGLWIATYTAGVFHCVGSEIQHYALVSDSKPVTLFSVYCDKAGGIWLGTHTSGAYRFDGKVFVRFMSATN